MIGAVSSLTAPATPAAQTNSVQASAASPASSKTTAQPVASDTVQISSAAKAFSQENLETPAQTAQEARGGDTQAIRLLARHAAARISVK